MTELKKIQRSFSHLNDQVYVTDQYYQDTSLLNLRPLVPDEHTTTPLKNRRKSIVKEYRSIQDLEEHLSMEDLKTLKKLFHKTVADDDIQQNITEKETSLNKQEFIEALSQTKIFQEFHQYEFELLFNKLDTKEQGFINWSDFCNQLIVKYNEVEFAEENLNFIPFINKIKIKFSAHNKRHETVKLLTMENPWRFLNISRTGSVGFWSKNLTFIKNFQITDSIGGEADEGLTSNQSTAHIWITDAVLLKSHHKICVGTSKRNLRFFSISAEYFTEEFVIFGLPNSTSCLEYCYNKEKNEAFLIVGDTSGQIHAFHFLNPNKSFYNLLHKPVKGVLEIHLSHLVNHSDFIKYTQLHVHTDCVQSIQFIWENKAIVSSSAETEKSVVISDPSGLKKDYVFSLSKGCSCFDFNLELHLLVTASLNSCIYLWNYYTPTAPISALRGHIGKVISLKIQETVNYLYSLSADSVLKAWDLQKETQIQSINLDFLQIQTNLDYAQNPMLYFTTEDQSGFIIGCCDYLGIMPIGETFKLIKQVPVTHENPITSMVYCNKFQTVVTCTENSEIICWNLLTGKKLITIKNAHENEEITYSCTDKSQRRLFTAARDGTIKAWNMSTGHCIQDFKRIDDKEVTGLVIRNNAHSVLSVGWSMKIVSYVNVAYEPTVANPVLLWHGDTQHDDDILCCDSYNTLLATGSYDGQIKIWSIETQRLFSCLQNAYPEIRIDSRDPVEKLLFLKHRASVEFNSCVLVSSERGFLKFWKLQAKNHEHLCAKFYASAFGEQAVLSITTDSENKILITGDTLGFVYVWDIEIYALSRISPDKYMEDPPNCITSWRAHDSAVVAIEYIPISSGISNNELLLTASTDKCCRLWTLSGEYIGVFGQENNWNLLKPSTFQSQMNKTVKMIQQLKRKNEKLGRMKKEKSLENKESIDSTKKAVEKVVDIENIFSKRDPLKNLKAFKIKRINFEYDVNNIQDYKMTNEKKDSKQDMKINSFTSLPIHEFSEEVNEELLSESFDQMKFKLPKII